MKIKRSDVMSQFCGWSFIEQAAVGENQATEVRKLQVFLVKAAVFKVCEQSRWVSPQLVET